MKKVKFERLGIILFCATLIGSGALTLLGSVKPIAKKTLAGMQSGYEANGVGGLIEGGINGLESAINENVFARTSYINLFGLSAKLLDKHYIMDTNISSSVVKDNHDELQFICFPVDTTPYVEEISDLKSVLDELDTPLLYVQTPLKTIEGYTEMPEGITDYANSNTDTFLQNLDQVGVETLDLRQNIKAENLDLSDLFYTTDHHWKTQTAFWAVGEVTDYLKENLDIDLDPEAFYTNSANYESIVYEQSFLGSQGRRVGKYYGGIDDYTLMLPNYETDYTVTIHKSNSTSITEGSFKEAIVKENLLRPTDIFTNRYAAYFGADFPEVVIENHSAKNDMKVLIFKDSFGLPFSAFLSTMVRETRMLGTRYYNGDIKEYVKAYQPDLVLYVYKSINTQS